jgi:hypothetical protein
MDIKKSRKQSKEQKMKGFSLFHLHYIAGLYALSCQVKPDITPQIFWDAALETGDTITLSHKENKLQFGIIVNPNRLIETLKSNS